MVEVDVEEEEVEAGVEAGTTDFFTIFLLVNFVSWISCRSRSPRGGRSPPRRGRSPARRRSRSRSGGRGGGGGRRSPSYRSMSRGRRSPSPRRRG